MTTGWLDPDRFTFTGQEYLAGPQPQDAMAPTYQPVPNAPTYITPTDVTPDVPRDYQSGEELLNPRRAAWSGLMLDLGNYFLSGGKQPLQGIGLQLYAQAMKHNKAARQAMQPKYMQVGNRLMKVHPGGMIEEVPLSDDPSQWKVIGGDTVGYHRVMPDNTTQQLLPGVPKPVTPKVFGDSKVGYYTLGPDGAIPLVGGVGDTSDDKWTIVEDATGQKFEYNPRTRESRPFGGAPTGDAADPFKQADTLRDDWTRDAKQYLAQLDNLAGMRELARVYMEPTPGATDDQWEQDRAAADQALVFSYMKALDPGSVVREGEYATTSNTTGIPERIMNMYNKLVSGESLTEEQRKALLKSMITLGSSAATRLQSLREDYTGRAQRYGLNPADVLPGLEQFDTAEIDAWLGLGAGLPSNNLEPLVDPDTVIEIPGMDPAALEASLNGSQ